MKLLMVQNKKLKIWPVILCFVLGLIFLGVIGTVPVNFAIRRLSSTGMSEVEIIRLVQSNFYVYIVGNFLNFLTVLTLGYFSAKLNDQFPYTATITFGILISILLLFMVIFGIEPKDPLVSGTIYSLLPIPIAILGAYLYLNQKEVHDI